MKKPVTLFLAFLFSISFWGCAPADSSPKDDRYRTGTIQNVVVVAGKSTDLTRLTISPK